VNVREIEKAMKGFVEKSEADLLAMSADEIANEWWWTWLEWRTIEWNTYSFSSTLESHKRRWRKWEEHHHGSCCVVKRVRNKYVMPRIREFLAALDAHSAEKTAPTGK
jgi:hypothetical protein